MIINPEIKYHEYQLSMTDKNNVFNCTLISGHDDFLQGRDKTAGDSMTIQTGWQLSVWVPTSPTDIQFWKKCFVDGNDFYCAIN